MRPPILGPGRLVKVLGLAAAAGAIALGSGPSALAGPPPGFTLQTVVAGLDQPTAFAFAPDGRVFVAEKAGRVVVVSGGSITSTFIDLRAETNSHLDRGLIGLALDPNFAQNRRVYLSFTEELRPDDPDRAHTAGGRLIRIAASAGNPGVADLATRNDLITDFESQGETHSVGGIRFDPQGRLLMTMGDGADHLTVDPLAFRSYDLDHPNGKLLRLDPETGDGVPGNPYYAPALPNSHRSRVLARGLRNPFRFQIDPATGRIYVGDVGWSTWEEINLVEPTTTNPDVERNFGWPCYEGGQAANGAFVSVQQNGYNFQSACNAIFPPTDQPQQGTGPGAAAPLYSYRHAPGVIETDAAVVAGPIYPGGSYGAAYAGHLFFGDFARDSLSTRAPNGSVSSFGTPGGFGAPVDIQLGPDGDVYYSAIAAGQIRRIVNLGGNTPPVAKAGAEPRSGKAPLRVQFSAFGSSDPDGDPLTYRWSFGDGSPASSASNPLHTYTKRGTYQARLTVDDGQTGGQTTDSVRIDVDNSAPKIAVKRQGPSRYRVGTRLKLTFGANDAESGAIAARRIKWRVLLHHSKHVHFFRSGSGRVLNLRVPDHGDNSYFEVRLTVGDGDGATTTRSIRLRPRTVPVRLSANVPRVAGSLDGARKRLPTRVPSVVGGRHSATAPRTVTRAGGAFVLDHWRTSECNARAGTLRFRTPPRPLEAKAIYRRAGAATRDRLAPCLTGVRPAITKRAARVSFRLSEPARVLAQVNRQRRVTVNSRKVWRSTRLRRLPGRALTKGTRKIALGRLARGRYEVRVTAVDRAKNRRTVTRTLVVKR